MKLNLTAAMFKDGWDLCREPAKNMYSIIEAKIVGNLLEEPMSFELIPNMNNIVVKTTRNEMCFLV